MREHLHLYVPAVGGVILSVWLWVILARALRQRDRTGWRALPLCLPPLLASAAYGLFWFGFFSSPAMAVQLHAIRLTATHFMGPYLPAIGALWLLASTALLWPLVRRG